jgi:hypothetical protein
VTLHKRVAGLLTAPAAEWARIARETTDIGSIYRGYVVILAAIPAASLLLSLVLSGGLSLGRAALTIAVTAAVASYAMALATPIAAAVVLEHLAPRFKSHPSTLEVFKLVAYASTPIWLAGLFLIVLTLSRLAVFGVIWAAYLFFVGLSPVVGMPIEQRVPFTLVAAITILVIQLALGWIATLAGIPYYGM